MPGTLNLPEAALGHACDVQEVPLDGAPEPLPVGRANHGGCPGYRTAQRHSSQALKACHHELQVALPPSNETLRDGPRRPHQQICAGLAIGPRQLLHTNNAG
jgi:hypothetical protein